MGRKNIQENYKLADQMTALFENYLISSESSINVIRGKRKEEVLVFPEPGSKITEVKALSNNPEVIVFSSDPGQFFTKIGPTKYKIHYNPL